MFNHIYASGQSRRRSYVGYLYSTSSISGGTVCHHRGVCKERRFVHICETGISGVTGVTDTSFGVPSPDTFFVGVEDCAIDVAVCGAWAKLFPDANDRNVINRQHGAKARFIFG
jgi:hypothetical protein